MTEQPMKLRKESDSKAKHGGGDSEKVCVVHYSRNKTDLKLKPLTENNISKIRETLAIRCSSNDPKVQLHDICQKVPSDIDTSIYAVHRWCYQTFTNSSNLGIKRSRLPQDDTDELPPKRSRDTTSLLFPNQCLFCHKVRKWISKKGGTSASETLTKCITTSAEWSIKSAAEEIHDEDILRQIQGVDLIAKELQYHSSCRRDYTRSTKRHTADADVAKDAGIDFAQASHDAAFESLVFHIKDSILLNYNVERMSMLKERYLAHMQAHSPEHYNENYSTQKLKQKLIRKFGFQLKFWKPNYKSELVYSNEVPAGQAIEIAFEFAASPERQLEEAAMMLRRCVLDHNRKRSEIPWPPSADYLLSVANDIPDKLTLFLSCLLSGKQPKHNSTKVDRLCLSYGQDLCYAICQGQWKVSKHLLLGMALRHMTGSAELVTLINRYGHCISYSELLRLETSMSNQIVNRESLLPENIQLDNNIVTHFCWDNFDLNEETPSGSGTTHSTHGIVIQEISVVSATREQPQISRSRQRSATFVPKEIQPYYAKQQVEPVLELSEAAGDTTRRVQEVHRLDFIWTYTRYIKAGNQIVPGWNGWNSMIQRGSTHKHQSIVEYMAPIMAPITDNATVREVLRISQQATQEVNQPYTIVTCDLAVAKKAYAIVWQNPLEFENVIIRMGVFHTICSYFRALGKRMRGSGFSEIIIEAGICASGSVEMVLSGKHYNRAIRVHKLFVEALERLLLKEFLTSNPTEALDDDAREAIEQLCINPNDANLAKVSTNSKCQEFFERYSVYKNAIRNGENGNTAQFWLNYMDKIWLVLRFIRATKENDLDLHISCLAELCPLLFSYDHPNYARYVPAYYLLLLNLAKSHPGCEVLLQKNGFSVSRSDVPFSSTAVDMTIEQTINRHAKSHGGIIGFSRNVSAYYRWCVTRHTRATYVKAALDMADMSPNEEGTHKDTRPSQIHASDDDVEKVLVAITGFINPFTVDNKDALYCLSSGAQAPEDVVNDLLRADVIGEQAFREFVSNRLVEQSLSFHAPIKRQNLKTFAFLEQTKKVTTTKLKILQIRAERNIFGQLIMLSQDKNISLEKTLAYPLGPVPWALATPDGMPTKTDKAKLMHLLEKDVPSVSRPVVQDCVCIIDGNAQLHALLNIPDNFEALAQCVFDVLPRAPRIDFVTDSYGSDSIKSSEQQRRGSGKPLLIKGPKTKVPRNWKTFLNNAENKKQVISLILSEWKKNVYAAKIQGRCIYYVCAEEVTKLTSIDGINVACCYEQRLFSTHKEADGRIILHCMHVSREYPAHTIIVRSPDTDVFILLLKFCQRMQQTVLFDTGVGNKRRLLDIKALITKLGPDLCKSYPALHAMTGCDTTSAFVRRGKLGATKLFDKHPTFVQTFIKLGTGITLSESAVSELEHFVCAMYGYPQYTDINKLRYDMFRQKFQPKSGEALSSYTGIDISLLPPCKSSLEMHIKRVNYQTYLWNCSDVARPILPRPVDHGWRYDEQGMLAPEWFLGTALPQELADILPNLDKEGSAQDYDDSDEHVDFANLMDVIYDDET